MLFTSFAHRVLPWAAAFLLALTVLIAVEFGLLGPHAHSTFHRGLDGVEAYYAAHKKVADLVLGAIGIAVSALSAVWAIHKSWHYAERALPRRIAEFIEGREKRLIEGRQAIFNALNLGPAAGATGTRSPIVFRGPARRLVRDLNINPADVRQSLTAMRQALADEQEMVVRRGSEIVLQRSNAHLLMGCYLEGEASFERDNEQKRRSLNEAAMVEFKSALAFKPDDLQALDLAARQAILLNDTGSALAYRQKATELSQGDLARYAKALRSEADVHTLIKVNGSNGRARDALRVAIDTIDDEDLPSVEVMLEWALAQLALGRVQIEREKYWAAQTALKRAHDKLTELGAQRYATILLEVAQARDRLATARRDPESADAE